MDPRVQLVFLGEVLAGFQLDDVKRDLGRLLKLDETRVARLFSGKRTVLKRSVERPDAERYAKQLARFGALVHIEPLAAAPAPAVPAPPPTSVPAAAPPAEEEIVCPNCGERQSKRILCRACSTDMPMGIAAKIEAEQAARAERMAQARARHGLKPLRQATSAASDDAPGLWGIGFSGRMARLPYATGNTLVLTAMFVLIVFALQHPSLGRVIAMGLGFVAVFALSLRLTMLRCHDCNLSGWWSLILLLPYVGVVASLVLSFMPGSRGDNDHGELPREGRWLYLLAALAAMCVVIALLFRTVLMLAQHGVPVAVDGEDTPSIEEAAAALPPEAARVFRTEYAAAPPHKAFVVSPSGSWGWNGAAPSVEAAISGAMAHCEANRKPYTAACELVNVNGQAVGR